MKRYTVRITRSFRDINVTRRLKTITKEFEASDDGCATIRVFELARKAVRNPRHEVSAIIVARIENGKRFLMEPSCTWVDVCEILGKLS